jgi:glycosyltransferase involved in cell wall biosynthesis
MPSIYEGFGLPIIEANAFGTPTLTSNCSSLPEVAGDASILVDPLSIESITKGLLKLISDKELRMELAENAKKNAARFSWDRAAEQLVTLCKKLQHEKSSIS